MRGMLKEQIQDFCKAQGLTTIGFIPCRRFDELRGFYEKRQEAKLQNEFETSEIDERINPRHYMEEAKTIISIAFPYAESIPTQAEPNGFSVYTKRLDYHRVVKQYLVALCDYIESLGGKAMAFVDSNTLPERYIAYLAGLGFIGRNNMLITKTYGSYVFLGEILTDLEIVCEDQRNFEEMGSYVECGTCTNCYKACPTCSINKARINPNICLSYLTQKKELTHQEMGLLKGNVFGCDFCQIECPYNKDITSSTLEAFSTLDYMNDEARIYAEMDNKYFKEKMASTSCGWRGKNVIKRNAIIHMHQKGESIDQFRGESSYINSYIDRLSEK